MTGGLRSHERSGAFTSRAVSSRGTILEWSERRSSLTRSVSRSWRSSGSCRVSPTHVGTNRRGHGGRGIG